MSYRDFVAEKRRLTILRYLAEENGYSANDSVMHSVVEHFGFGCSRDMVRGDYAWLRDMGMVTVDEISTTVHAATITQRGLDVAAGRVQVAGIARPGPGA
ncbi:hypothetical protein [Thalassospira sp. MCCC 1A01428]|uniref:VpaChn25_0724 family phage protein n=1 Tax=Thalassospira sp. MCCC 1A01428 TaxID=1470575 RepID=UPI000A1E7A69|nr:hypothetical protein [Thalassospira sp. MCCC 1A01428]OSQ45550.1 hypothetical protein THS27_04260 [Thalassospira sp. MCCC 1A01428]